MFKLLQSLFDEKKSAEIMEVKVEVITIPNFKGADSPEVQAVLDDFKINPHLWKISAIDMPGYKCMFKDTDVRISFYQLRDCPVHANWVAPVVIDGPKISERDAKLLYKMYESLWDHYLKCQRQDFSNKLYQALNSPRQLDLF